MCLREFGGFIKSQTFEISGRIRGFSEYSFPNCEYPRYQDGQLEMTEDETGQRQVDVEGGVLRDTILL